MRKRICGLLLAGLLLSSPLWAADLSGNWQLHMTNQMGQAETWTTMTFKVTGNKLSIDAVHPNFKNIKGTGTLTGNKITMHFSLPGAIGPVLVDFKGTVGNGKMAGTRKVSYGPPSSGSKAGAGKKGGGPGGPPSGKQAGGAPPGGGTPPGGAHGGPPGGGGAPGGGHGGKISNTWTAVRK